MSEQLCWELTEKTRESVCNVCQDTGVALAKAGWRLVCEDCWCWLSQVDEAEHDRLHGWFEVAKIRLLAPVFGPLIGFQQPKGGKGHWVWEFMNGRVADPDGLKAAELLRQYTNSPEKFAEWLRRMEIAGPGTADGYVAVAKSFLRALALMPPKSRFGERTWGKPSRQDVEQIRRTEARLGVPGLFLKEKFEWEQDTVPAKDEVNHE